MRHRIIKQVLYSIKKYRLLTINKKQDIFLAFSGGIDSSVLFYILDRIKRTFLFNLNLLHINHRLRAISDEEERWVTNFALNNGVNLIIFRLKGPYSRPHDESIEQWAHNERHKVFENICRRYSNAIIATAHHSRDNLETMLLSLFKGNTGSPAEGMRVIDSRVIRPMLFIKKSDIEAFAKEFDIGHLHDPTNEETAYERNYIRLKIIPVIEDRFPGVYGKIEQFTNRTRLQKSFIDSLTEDFIRNNLNFEGQAYKLNLSEFYKLHEALKFEIIRKFLLISLKKGKSVSYNLISQTKVFIENRKGTVGLPGDRRLILADEYLIVI